MGYIKTHGEADTAPTYSCNSLGTPVWSGRHEVDFTDEMQHELKRFIIFEAKRQGHNDSLHLRIGENDTFFNSKFLNGWPQRCWRVYYQFGVSEQRRPSSPIDYNELYPSMPV